MPKTESSLPTYYTSLYRHGVDEKRRVQIPAKWRPKKQRGEDATFTLFFWPEGAFQEACLMVLPPAGVDDMVRRLNEMPPEDPKKPVLRRFLGEHSETVTVDSAGRICIPEAMARAVGIKDEAVLNGMFDRFQIWAPERYEATRPKVDAMAPEALKFLN